jgi:hypothetical protein
MKIDETAQEALNTLFASSPKAENLFEMSYGWAVNLRHLRANCVGGRADHQ